MKVFLMRNDINRYQFFLTDPVSDYPKLQMDGSRKAETWIPPKVFIKNPSDKVGDFYQTSYDVLIANSRATDALYRHFESAGELLPLPHKNRIFTVLNVTKCVNVLDEDTTVFREASGMRLGIERYAFKAERFSETSLFKIPQYNGNQIFVLEGANDFEYEFREAVEVAGLKGLRFWEIWDSESDEPGPIPPRIY